MICLPQNKGDHSRLALTKRRNSPEYRCLLLGCCCRRTPDVHVENCKVQELQQCYYAHCGGDARGEIGKEAGKGGPAGGRSLSIIPAATQAAAAAGAAKPPPAAAAAVAASTAAKAKAKPRLRTPPVEAASAEKCQCHHNCSCQYKFLLITVEKSEAKALMAVSKTARGCYSGSSTPACY
jgi:hypothetical protein